MDGDGHLEVSAIVPWTGDNPVDNLKGLYVFEYDVTTVAVDDNVTQMPTVYALQQNYPNPFNPVTQIVYELPEATRVTIAIYNLLGQRVKTLVSGQQIAGVHKVVWDGKDNLGNQVASGVYIYRLETENYSLSRKMVLVK
jgi:flagellar hook assembly protein FlgD